MNYYNEFAPGFPERLKDIIRGGAVIMTTNLSPSQWSARDHRIASRLHRSGSYLLQCETVD